jgi:hypothetical protein
VAAFREEKDHLYYVAPRADFIRRYVSDRLHTNVPLVVVNATLWCAGAFAGAAPTKAARRRRIRAEA